MNTEDDEFNRIEREAAMRMEAVSATVEKRGWVGLTVDERREVWLSREAQTPTTFAKDIEAKLKEKNE
jgi:hypothetical protein